MIIIAMTLTPKGYRPRIVDGQVSRMIAAAGAICIQGPKWCGKTWAAKNAAASVFDVGDPYGNFQNRRIAEADVYAAFQGEEPHLIDEWQEVPAIWDATRHMVDENPRKGRFILTGSSTPKIKGIMHSGAGRIADVKMRTMSLFESGDSEGTVSLRALFDGTQKTAVGAGDVNLEKLVSLTVRGGWPALAGQSAESARDVVSAYLDRIISDASIFDGKVRDRNKIAMLIRSLARNESTYASDARLRSDMMEYEDDTLSAVTVSEYKDVLSRMFILEDQPSFSANFRSKVRVGKTPKRHLTDPALAIAALGMDSESLINDLNTYGFMFEAMCERDLDIYASSMKGSLSQYRDANGHEIDAVVSLSGGRWGAFEIKLGTNQIDSAAKGLLAMASKAEEGSEPAFLCVLCGFATAAYRRDDGVWVVPPTLLRDRRRLFWISL